ncbi:MAG: phytoene desaturase [Candidatus Nanopelagicales bacterium]|nr:phytoene desaturase [Candidatus Nanopelagicales bacterium]MCF8538049.1 phytoene desaturase [Candidatus Nanopelagicales bacterium]MCF8541973.1 phytoene desaturase [Candidatus Nanopelagicales bacterium]MCF8556105.1 phytoene desaturase [Candidatus Nanopelagicales bacterium]
MRTVTGPTDNVVVVGAGLAGLSAAMRLAGAGRSVTVIEREPIPGGRAGRLNVQGADGTYRFDTGPTVLTMPDLIADAFDCLGEEMSDWLTLEPIDPLYRSFFPDGSVMDVHSDVEQMADEIDRVIGPDEAAGYKRYVDFVSQLYRYEMKDFIDRNIDSPFDLITPDLARLVAIGGFRRLSPKVRQFLKDPRTERIYSFQAMYAGVSPQDALAIYAVIAYMDSVAGVFFPKGGMHAVPAAMAAAAEKHGVTFRYSTEVERVEVTGSRATAVITSDGERIPADTVVLNPDLPVAHRDLLGREPWSVRRLNYSPSCFLLLAGSSAHYSKIAHHNIHFGRSWAGVFDELIDRQQLMSDPSILVTNPSHSDPDLAPPGKEVYYVLFPTPNLDADIDWKSMGSRYRDEVVTTLEARGYVGFGDAIEVEDITTPLDWEARGMERGAPFASAHSFFQTGPFRPSNMWGENVVFTGSGTQPGVGVPMVLISGRLAAERITGKDPSYRSRAVRW